MKTTSKDLFPVDVKELFPMDVKVTNDILKKADLGNPYACIGARALRRALWGNIKTYGIREIQWGSITGYISDRGGTEYYIRAYDADDNMVDMMEITKPHTVTFKIINTIPSQ